MIKKVTLLLFSFFLVRLLSSCCDCGEQQSFEINYISTSTQFYNTAGYNDVIVEDSVLRKAFGLTVAVHFEILEMSSLWEHNFNFGFNSAVACSCGGNLYQYTDIIEQVQISVIDFETKEETIVTNSFLKLPFKERESMLAKKGPIIEVQGGLYPEFDIIQFELTQYDVIPDVAVFVIKVQLESGISFTNQTDSIKFYD